MSLRFLVLSTLVACVPARNTTTPQLDLHWELFKTVYSKEYSSGEELSRRLVWEDNVDFVQKHNMYFDLGRHKYSLGINRFADLTSEEYRRYYLGFRYNQTRFPGRRPAIHRAASFQDLPSRVDWREKGYVTPVKDQGQCGSCWAFSATGSLEGQHFKKTGRLVSLSEQNLVDCTNRAFGCQGGVTDFAFWYISRNGGIDTEASYPYQAKNGPCRFDPDHVGATDIGHHDVRPGSEEDLQSAVGTVGPVSAAIDASSDTFRFYKHGVYDDPGCSSQDLDHGVLVVGYGSQDDVDYWIVKNSWGSTWGDKGYILMSRNGDNQCGIATAACYPLV